MNKIKRDIFYTPPAKIHRLQKSISLKHCNICHPGVISFVKKGSILLVLQAETGAYSDILEHFNRRR